MSKTVLHEGDEGVTLIIRDAKRRPPEKTNRTEAFSRSPVHVVYGGADRFASGTAGKLGKIALRSLETYASDLAEFASVFGLPSGGEFRKSRKNIKDLERQFVENPDELRSANYPAWLAAAVRERTLAKLRSEPIEDFRIDFEDGYGFRPDAEEDADAERCAAELAAAFRDRSITTFSGFRIKSYCPETRDRSRRTLNIFLDEFLELTRGKLPENFVVTLPKVTDKKEVAAMCRDLKKIEKMARIKERSVKIELMVEHPLALIDKKGNFALRQIVEAARGRCVAAHFGAYDYTAALGIVASHQDIAHPACDFARQMMLAALTPLGIRLSDSVTIEIPAPIHRSEKLSAKQKAENKAAVIAAWRTHYSNVRRSMASGFYQSWDLHPNQLVARYAAVYSFFLETADAQAARLRAFIEKATKATLTGNTFDDAATAMGIVNFFRQGLDCGALRESEVESATGLTIKELRKSDAFRR
jgi:citrate lyase beta subunit